MRPTPRPIAAILAAGSAGSVLSAAALGAASAASGKGVWQPLNATSHWRHGAAAAAWRAPDLAHTGVGAATHWAATVFWAAEYEAAMRIRPPRTRRGAFAVATTVAAVAAFVDYRLTPRRFTPGWEYVLDRGDMAIGYAAMAVGLHGGRAWVCGRPGPER